MYKEATPDEINEVMNLAWQAFHEYRKLSLKERAAFMRAIGKEIELLGDELLMVAHKETNLSEARLRSERTRTIFQLNSYADACESGNWMDVRIDTAMPKRNPPKQDIRKMLVPLGPVIVFGASNFPFAYSTAGGDTACAFAAGCPVIVKAHPAHAETSEMVASAIFKAAANCYLPKGIFAHVHGGNETGKALVMHPFAKAVGFTGSYAGGKQLFDWGNERKNPIPVFAEMGSVNPVFLLPRQMKQEAASIAKLYAASITLGAGQFCTNPGVVVGIDNDDLQEFISTIGREVETVAPATMLHTGIFKSYVEKRALAISQSDVDTVAVSGLEPLSDQGLPTIASTTATAFLNNPVLHQEVFGPYSIVVRCKDMNEMLQVALQMEGQLTTTLMATDDDIRDHEEMVEAVKNICGRLILNSVPTGVEVCLSMQHGGPFPATTDSRFTSVGADGIKRFARPVCFQNWSNNLLPLELRNENPTGIYRMVNNKLSAKSI